MTIFALVIGLLAGVALGAFLFKSRRKQPYLASAEYWIYLPGTELPDQQDVMHRMLAENPYRIAGASPIGPSEGILFSDVRLHIALVLKAKNPHAFRADMFSEALEPTEAQLHVLSGCESFAKIRFISEEPLPDKRHVTFLVHAADAIAGLAGSDLIYDLVAERLIDREDFKEALRTDPTGTQPDLHVRVVWKRTAFGGQSETRGLRKIGIEDLISAEMESDERVLVVDVMEEASRAIWKLGVLPDPLEVTAFDDQFRICPQAPKDGRLPVRIMRVQSA